jgi:hypothetical protein
MSDVIRDITCRSGCPLRIYELRTDWLAQRITLHEPASLPFWKAVDRLCEVGRFRYNLGLGSVSLFRGELSGPASDFGAFRVMIKEIFFSGRYRQLHLGRDHAPRPISRDDHRDDSFIKLEVWVEPRMLIRNGGPLKRLSAVDDRGQSLLPADPGSKQPDFDIGFTQAGAIGGQMPLARLGQPGRLIRKLRGIAPVVVAGRRPEPVVVPLAGATGRSYRSDETVVTIRAVTKVTPTMKIVIEPVDPEGRPRKVDRNPRATMIELALRPIERLGLPTMGENLSEDQFEVVDSAGRLWKPSPWWLSDTKPQRKDGEIHVQLIPADDDLSPWPGDLTGANLRYYDTIVQQVDVPFEFADVLLP